MKNENPLALAKNGEDLAASILSQKGYTILQMNFHSRFGEIDIIAKSPSHIIFTEVKTRSFLNRDLALEAVSLKKQKRILKTALHFLQQHQEYNEFMIRFDIILVFYHHATENFSIEHIEDAFSFSGV